MRLTLQPVLVQTGEEGQGLLAFRNGWLVAVLVQLSEIHGDQAGHWFLEKGFGVLDGPQPPVFPDVQVAERWIAERLYGSA